MDKTEIFFLILFFLSIIFILLYFILLVWCYVKSKKWSWKPCDPFDKVNSKIKSAIIKNAKDGVFPSEPVLQAFLTDGTINKPSATLSIFSNNKKKTINSSSCSNVQNNQITCNFEKLTIPDLYGGTQYQGSLIINNKTKETKKYIQNIEHPNKISSLKLNYYIPKKNIFFGYFENKNRKNGELTYLNYLNGKFGISSSKTTKFVYDITSANNLIYINNLIQPTKDKKSAMNFKYNEVLNLFTDEKQQNKLSSLEMIPIIQYSNNDVWII